MTTEEAFRFELNPLSQWERCLSRAIGPMREHEYYPRCPNKRLPGKSDRYCDFHQKERVAK